jgi:hypothetical protein
MGCVIDCFKNTEYEPIKDEPEDALDASESSPSITPSKSINGEHAFQNVPDINEEEKSKSQFDLNSNVFKGSVVEQKFSNKSSYDPKFAWVNYATRTLNLSEFMTKERRHKEASLSDVVHVVAGAPEKLKKDVVADNSLCLSVKFVRGGGIDLLFKTTAERDLWFDVIQDLVSTNVPMSAVVA